MRLIPQKDVAILVFANSSTEELGRKSIPENGRFFDALTEQTLATARKTQFPYFHITEKHQNGDTFGERFTNAIQSVFDQGFESIITIGNDTPHLKASHLIEASIQLAKGKTVLGPSADGGFYLMGLHSEQFDASKFEKLSWQTSGLFQEVSALLNVDNVGPIRLQTLFDLDDFNDLRLFFARFKDVSRKLFELIRSLLVVVAENFFSLSIVLDDYLSKTFYNKGSPLLLHS